jgi:hypothetical protein
VDDLEAPSREHLRVLHAEERLQSFRSDRAAAWAIAAFVVFLWIQYPSSTWTLVVGGVIAVALLASAAAARLKRRFRRR